MTGFENVGIFIREKVWLEPNSDAGELPRRKPTTFRTGRKFEIKKVRIKGKQLGRRIQLAGLTA